MLKVERVGMRREGFLRGYFTSSGADLCPFRSYKRLSNATVGPQGPSQSVWCGKKEAQAGSRGKKGGNGEELLEVKAFEDISCKIYENL